MAPPLPATMTMDPPDGTPPVTFTDSRPECAGVSVTWEGDFIIALTLPTGQIETDNLPTATLDAAIEAAGTMITTPRLA